MTKRSEPFPSVGAASAREEWRRRRARMVARQ
jgi:hypothetical protein